MSQKKNGQGLLCISKHRQQHNANTNTETQIHQDVEYTEYTHLSQNTVQGQAVVGTYLPTYLLTYLLTSLRQLLKFTNQTHIYMYITIYLPRTSFMFRCGIHHLQGGLLVLLLKPPSFFTRLLSTVGYIKELKVHTAVHNVIYNIRYRIHEQHMNKKGAFSSFLSPRDLKAFENTADKYCHNIAKLQPATAKNT